MSDVINTIKARFSEAGNPAEIPLLKGGTFKAELIDEGIMVDNLGAEPFLPWLAFTEAVTLLAGSGGRAQRGDAMNAKLGDPDLPITSLEGYLAHVVYGKEIGDSVFRRSTPIVNILIWAGICQNEGSGIVALIK